MYTKPLEIVVDGVYAVIGPVPPQRVRDDACCWGYA